MKVPFLIGRLIFGGFFVYSGINHFLKRPALAQYAGAKHVPAPDVAVTLSGAAILVGGMSVLLGLKPKIGAGAIIAFLAAVSPAMHDFWKAEDPGQRQNDMINFMKNMAMLGAAIALLGVEEPWPASVPLTRPGAGEKLVQLAHKIAA